jgi:arylsulfatase A-like enzyme
MFADGRVDGFRRRVLLLATLGLAAPLALDGSGAFREGVDPAAAAQSPPNIVVIETDDQTLESMRVMDNVKSLIADHGATFENSFVNYSLCCPSRATFLTGQYMHNHGVLGNNPPDGGFERFQELHGENNLAVWLEDAGYYTGMVGKYLNGYTNDPRVPAGWSDWHAAADDADPDDDLMAYDYTLNNNGSMVSYGESPAEFKQDVLTGKAVGFVNRRAPKAQPFFLWLTYTAPHGGGPDPNPNQPFNCGSSETLGTAKPAPRHAHAFDTEPLPMPPNFNEADVSDKPADIRRRPRLTSGRIADIRRKYRCELESLLSVDEGVKRVVDALRAKRELSSTLLVYTSDNGFFHGEHRIPDRKTKFYEESIRVPLMIRGPGMGIPRRVTVSDLTTNADLAPTLVDVADATPGLVMDGVSLIPVAQEPGIEEGRELLIEQHNLAAIRTEGHVYAEWNSGEREFYDLAEDPFQLRSRHDDPDYASVRAQLAARLHRLKVCAGPSCQVHP